MSRKENTWFIVVMAFFLALMLVVLIPVVQEVDREQACMQHLVVVEDMDPDKAEWHCVQI